MEWRRRCAALVSSYVQMQRRAAHPRSLAQSWAAPLFGTASAGEAWPARSFTGLDLNRTAMASRSVRESLVQPRGSSISCRLFAGLEQPLLGGSGSKFWTPTSVCSRTRFVKQGSGPHAPPQGSAKAIETLPKEFDENQEDATHPTSSLSSQALSSALLSRESLTLPNALSFARLLGAPIIAG